MRFAAGMDEHFSGMSLFFEVLLVRAVFVVFVSRPAAR